jgi:site-specific recombinase XerD
MLNDSHITVHLHTSHPSHSSRTYPPEVLSRDEAMRLLAACGDDALGLRHRAMLILMYRCGLRIAETLAIGVHDVDAQRGSILVRCGKGRRSRTVGIDPAGARVLQDWIARRQSWLVHASRCTGPISALNDQPLICDQRGRRLTTGYVRRLMTALGRLAGITRRVHAHGLRHTMASELREEGLDIGIISKQLGHRSITTTARYLDHIAPLAVLQAMAKREW